MSVVGVGRVVNPLNKQEIGRVLRELLDNTKLKERIRIPDQARVVIKINICSIKGFETGATVDPFIVRCLVEWLLERNNVQTIVIGEADGTYLNADLALSLLGWRRMFGNYPEVRLLNLAKDEITRVKLDGLLFKELRMSRTYMESDFLISVGKLKTHSLCRISCILKNQFGAMSRKGKARFHKNLDKAIFDLNKVKLPNLCIVDGLIGMEEYGPISGIPKPAGIIIVGNDPVATDHACAKIMDINPNKISYLKLASRQHLGTTRYETYGMSLDDAKTKFLPDKPIWKRAILRTATTVLDILPK